MAGEWEAEEAIKREGIVFAVLGGAAMKGRAKEPACGADWEMGCSERKGE